VLVLVFYVAVEDGAGIELFQSTLDARITDMGTKW